MRIVWLLLLLFLFMSGSVCLAEQEETSYLPFNEAFYNPVLSDANDPWIIKDDDAYYYCRSRGGVQIIRSETLTGLMAAVENPNRINVVFVRENQTEIWAPELHHYQDRWYAFYAADYDKDNTLHRMYVARSVTDDPMGDWEEPVKLGLPDDQWAIDGTFFEYKDGRIFFIWSGWRDKAQGTSLWKQYLYITQLETGDPTKVIGTERVMISKPQYYWEMSVLPQNEGPSVITSPDGTYYCMYAGNYSGSNEYVVATLRLNGDPLDPKAWEKLSKPILKSNEDMRLYAPGHASFVKSPDGTEDWILYHSAKADLSGWDRNGRAQRLTWIDDKPTSEGVLPNDELIPLPSGEIVDRISMQLEDGELSENAVLLSNLTTSPAVSFPTRQEFVRVRVRAPQDGLYAVYIRHNSDGEGNGTIWVKVNDSTASKAISAKRGGDETQFIVDCVLLKLSAGVNTLEWTAQEQVAIDQIILDRTPIID